MKVYTKTGDNGETSLFGGVRVPKSSIRTEAYGTADELNAQLGVIRALKPHPEVENVLEKIQDQLFFLGADLSAPLETSFSKVQRIQQADIKLLEDIIDRIDSVLEPLDSFIYPGGSQVGAELHAARTICRRAERIVDALGRQEKINSNILIYLNRAADLFFVLARYANKLSGTDDVKWSVSKGQ